MKRPVNFRLSEDALRILAKAADRFGLNRTAALEMIVRQYEERPEKADVRGPFRAGRGRA